MNSFDSRATLTSGNKSYTIYRLPALTEKGFDLSRLPFCLKILLENLLRREDGVNVTAADICFAKELGYRIKLLAIIKAEENGEIEVRVHPTLIPQSHVLASVNGVFNAVAVRGDIVGDTLFYGRGAGQDPTSSAVISDLADAALAIETPRRGYGFTPHELYGNCKPIGEIESQYYLRISVDDKPGVLAQVAGILGKNNIGISSVIQPEAHEVSDVPLVLMIHDATNAQMQAALADIKALDCVKKQPRLIRVETFNK